MPSDPKTGNELKADISANLNDITPPHDGAVFYTNRGRPRAEAYVLERASQNQSAKILEQTPKGRELDGRNLLDTSHPPLGSVEKGAEVWDHASKTYAEQASGRVTVITNYKPIKEDSFFARVERDTLIRNEKVTHINGVERKTLHDDLKKIEKASPEDRAQLRSELNSRIEKNAPKVAEKSSRWEQRVGPGSGGALSSKEAPKK